MKGDLYVSIFYPNSSSNAKAGSPGIHAATSWGAVASRASEGTTVNWTRRVLCASLTLNCLLAFWKWRKSSDLDGGSSESMPGPIRLETTVSMTETEQFRRLVKFADDVYNTSFLLSKNEDDTHSQYFAGFYGALHRDCLDDLKRMSS